MVSFRWIFLIFAAAGAANAQEPDPQDGRDLYQTYCWQCHGREATGNGPMAEMLAIETPDQLTDDRINSITAHLACMMAYLEEIKSSVSAEETDPIKTLVAGFHQNFSLACSKRGIPDEKHGVDWRLEPLKVRDSFFVVLVYTCLS